MQKKRKIIKLKKIQLLCSFLLKKKYIYKSYTFEASMHRNKYPKYFSYLNTHTLSFKKLTKTKQKIE